MTSSSSFQFSRSAAFAVGAVAMALLLAAPPVHGACYSSTGNWRKGDSEGSITVLVQTRAESNGNWRMGGRRYAAYDPDNRKVVKERTDDQKVTLTTSKTPLFPRNKLEYKRQLSSPMKNRYFATYEASGQSTIRCRVEFEGRKEGEIIGSSRRVRFMPLKCADVASDGSEGAFEIVDNNSPVECQRNFDSKTREFTVTLTLTN